MTQSIASERVVATVDVSMERIMYDLDMVVHASIFHSHHEMTKAHTDMAGFNPSENTVGTVTISYPPPPPPPPPGGDPGGDPGNGGGTPGDGGGNQEPVKQQGQKIDNCTADINVRQTPTAYDQTILDMQIVKDAIARSVADSNFNAPDNHDKQERGFLVETDGKGSYFVVNSTEELGPDDYLNLTDHRPQPGYVVMEFLTHPFSGYIPETGGSWFEPPTNCDTDNAHSYTNNPSTQGPGAFGMMITATQGTFYYGK